MFELNKNVIFFPSIFCVFFITMHSYQFQEKIFCELFAAFSEGMVDDGYGDVVNIDISSVVIEAMQNKYRDRPHLKCILLYN